MPAKVPRGACEQHRVKGRECRGAGDLDGRVPSADSNGPDRVNEQLAFCCFPGQAEKRGARVLLGQWGASQ